MNYTRIALEDRRLVILRCLHEDPDYSINESLLGKALVPWGHGVGRDVVRADLAWLAEVGLLKVESLPRHDREPLQVATLTERGAEVAEGRARVPGVARPTPGG